MEKNKIAFVGNSSKTMYNFRYGVMAALAKDGYQVTVIAPRDSDITPFRQAGIRFISIEIDCKGMNPFLDLKLVRELTNLYKKEHFDYIFHYTIKPVIYGGWAAAMAKIPQTSVVTGLGYTFIRKGWINRLSQWLYRNSLRHANEVWFLNQEDKTLFVERNIVAARKARVISGEGVNMERFKPSTGTPTNFSFLFVGRVLWDKGVGEFVAAAKEVKKQHPKVCFKILGPLGASNPASISSEQMDEWEKTGVIKYLGETNDVVPYIANTSCLVLPSYREGVSRVLLEAASMAKPIIASNVPGCREVVVNGLNGFLCEPQNTSSLIACMMHILSLSEEERQEFGKNGRERIHQLYDEEIIIQLYRDRLTDLLAESC